MDRILIDDEFFLCTRKEDEEGRIEYGFQIKQGIDKTVEKLVELYNIEAKLEVIKECIK